MTDTVLDASPTHARESRLPGVPGIWIFVLIDMSVFGLLFLSYALERSQHPGLFAASQAALNVEMGFINMLVLLTSSWFVALAVHAARDNQQALAARLLGAGFLCGLVFTIIKVVEYTAKIRAGISMLSNDFFMFYFVLTFIHFLHVLGGMVALAVLARKTKQGAYGSGKVTGIEIGATYWHMVDLLWVMLFPLLYIAN